MASPDSTDRDESKAPATGAQPGSERYRDEAREEGGPRYGGEAWKVADERGDKRFGHARNDDSDPSELARGEVETDDPESVEAADLTLAERDAEGSGEIIEHGAQVEGMRRGDKPGVPRDRE